MEIRELNQRLPNGEKIAVYSIRVADHRVEKIADLFGIQTTGTGAVAMTPDGRPLIVRNVSFSEIYALDFEAP